MHNLCKFISIAVGTFFFTFKYFLEKFSVFVHQSELFLFQYFMASFFSCAAIVKST